MNRPLTALLAALESLLVVGLGLGVLLAPLTAVWAVTYDLRIGWGVFYRIAADVWLAGHGVDIRFVLDPSLATALGLPGAGAPFVVTIAALGFALGTALFAVRAGGRLARTEYPRLAVLSSVGTFALLSAIVVLTAGTAAAQPSRWQGVLLPTLVFAVGLAIGRLRARPGSDIPRRSGMRGGGGGLPFEVQVAVREGLRIGAGAVAGLVAIASVLVAILLATRYATVSSLYESLQTGALGGAVLTLGQLALLPDLVLWAAAWLVGPGFAIGTGSSVSPLGTALGPIPGLPVLGALPSGNLAWGFLGLLVPVVVSFLLGAVLRPRLDRALMLPASFPGLLGVGGVAGLAGGLVLGILTSLATGSAGPGRLAEVGASPFLVGLLAALEIAAGATLGLVTGAVRHAVSRPASEQETVPQDFLPR